MMSVRNLEQKAAAGYSYSPTELIESNLLVSELDILEAYALHFVRMMELVKILSEFTTQRDISNKKYIETDRLENIRSQFNDIMHHTDALDMRVSSRTCIDILADIDTFALIPADPIRDKLANKMSSLGDNIKRELESTKFKFVQFDSIKYFEAHQFSDETRAQFGASLYDMEEAGKCFALERYTACAYHLMRITELGIRKIENEYGLEESRTWSVFLSNLREYAYKTGKPEGREKKIMALHARIVGVKEAWRDDTIHTTRRYDKSEAHEVFEQVKHLMTFVSGKLP